MNDRKWKFAAVMGLIAMLFGVYVLAARAQDAQQATHTVIQIGQTYRVGPTQYLFEVTLKDGTRCLLYGTSGISCEWKK